MHRHRAIEKDPFSTPSACDSCLAMIDFQTALSGLRSSLRFDGLFWRRFMYLGCVYGPEWWKRYSPPLFAAVIFTLVGRNRRGSIANMTKVLGQPTRWQATTAALRMWAQFSHCMTETMEYLGPRPQDVQIDLPEHDVLADALNEGRGVIILTAHFGNWDIAAKTLRNYGRPINLVMAREPNETTQQYVRLVREAAGVQTIFSDNSVFSSLNILNALKRNEIIAIQFDRPPNTESVRWIPFFGSPAPFPLGPFTLARLSGAPMFVIFIPRRSTRHYEIRVARRFSVPRDIDRKGGIDRMMVDAVEALESAIREFPDQWFQFQPFWPPVTPENVVALPAATTDPRDDALVPNAQKAKLRIP